MSDDLDGAYPFGVVTGGLTGDSPPVDHCWRREKALYLACNAVRSGLSVDSADELVAVAQKFADFIEGKDGGSAI